MSPITRVIFTYVFLTLAIVFLFAFSWKFALVVVFLLIAGYFYSPISAKKEPEKKPKTK